MFKFPIISFTAPVLEKIGKADKDWYLIDFKEVLMNMQDREKNEKKLEVPKEREGKKGKLSANP